MFWGVEEGGHGEQNKAKTNQCTVDLLQDYFYCSTERQTGPLLNEKMLEHTKKSSDCQNLSLSFHHKRISSLKIYQEKFVQNMSYLKLTKDQEQKMKLYQND